MDADPPKVTLDRGTVISFARKSLLVFTPLRVAVSGNCRDQFDFFSLRAVNATDRWLPGLASAPRPFNRRPQLRPPWVSPFQQGPEFNSYVKLPIRLAQAQAVPFGSVSLPKISRDADPLRYRFSCMVWDSVQRDA